MLRSEWRKTVDDDAARRRAGGRRAYNWRRQLHALLRRKRLVEVFRYNHGDIGRAAAALGVCRQTIWRDRRALGMDFHGAWRLLGARHMARLGEPLDAEAVEALVQAEKDETWLRMLDSALARGELTEEEYDQIVARGRPRLGPAANR